MPTSAASTYVSLFLRKPYSLTVLGATQGETRNLAIVIATESEARLLETQLGMTAKSFLPEGVHKECVYVAEAEGKQTTRDIVTANARQLKVTPVDRSSLLMVPPFRRSTLSPRLAVPASSSMPRPMARPSTLLEPNPFVFRSTAWCVFFLSFQ